MKSNFSTGLLAGILLASVLVVASSYSSGPSLSGSAVPSATTFQAATTTATATTSSSTAQPAPATTVQATLSNLSATAGAGDSASNRSSTVLGTILAPGISTPPPSSLASIVNQPGHVPLLLLPVLAALLIGFGIYKASVQKE